MLATQLDDPPHQLSFEVVIPSSSSIGQFWPESQGFVALPEGLQKTITTPFHAIYVAFQLLQVMFPVDHEAHRSRSLTQYEQLQPWALDSTVSLWRSFQNWAAISGTVLLREELQELYEQLLERIALPRLHDECSFSCSSKSAMVFIPALLHLIQYSSDSQCNEPAQVRLASLLNRLHHISDVLADPSRSSSQRLLNLGFLIKSQVEPSIADYCRDVSKFSILHRDLQLALCLWTSPGDWPVEIEELRSHLCSKSEQFFVSDTLNEDPVSVLLIKRFCEINTEEPEHPAKRRKTLPDSGKNEGRSLYDDIVMSLNGSTSESLDLSLDRLNVEIGSRYAAMPENQEESDQEQCRLLVAISKIACAGARCLQLSDSRQTWENASCIVCDSTDVSRHVQSRYWNVGTNDTAWTRVIAGITMILEEETFEQSSRARVLMAVAIGRVFNHISSPGHLDLSNPLGEWLVKTLTRSLREARIAAS